MLTLRRRLLLLQRVFEWKVEFVPLLDALQ